MGCVKSKKKGANVEKRAFVESCFDPGLEKFVSFQQQASKNLPDPPHFPSLSLDLRALSDRNVLPLKFPLTPSFRRAKKNRTLIKRHSAPEPKRGAFPLGVKPKLTIRGSTYQYPEAKRQAQLSSVLKSIDDTLEMKDQDQADPMSELLKCLRRSLFNSNVDAAAAKSLFHSINQMNSHAPGKLFIDLSKPTEMINTQHSFSQGLSELSVVIDLIRCVPCNLYSLRLSNFQISTERLTDLAYGLNACQNMTILCLKTCSLDDGFIEIFTKGLMKANLLLELDISGNFIRDAGLLKLGLFMLSGKSQLRFLDVSQNFFTLNAIESFGAMFLASNNWNMRLLTDSRIHDVAIDGALKDLYRNQFKLRKKFHGYKLFCKKYPKELETCTMLLLLCNENLSCCMHSVLNRNVELCLPGIEDQSFTYHQRDKGFFLTTGHRLQMEDFISFQPKFRNKENENLYAILDGHGGVETARIASFLIIKYLMTELDFVETCITSDDTKTQETGEKEQEKMWQMTAGALKGCFQQTHKFLETNSIPHGSCALLVYQKGHHLFAANAGDSQGLIIEFVDAPTLPIFTPVATIKRPSDDDEQKRIEQANGLVLRGRVDGTIAVSRALGDVEYQPKITYIPFVSYHNLKQRGFKNSRRLLVLASDGLWDFLSYEEASLFVQNYFATQPNKMTCCWKLSKLLTEIALKKGSRDNICCVITEI